MSFQKKKTFYVLLSYFPSRPCSHLQAAFLDMRAASLVNLKHILVPRGRALLGQHQDSRPLIGWEYETNALRMFRKSAPARGHDSWCWPKEARSLVFYVYFSQTYKSEDENQTALWWVSRWVSRWVRTLLLHNIVGALSPLCRVWLPGSGSRRPSPTRVHGWREQPGLNFLNSGL